MKLIHASAFSLLFAAALAPAAGDIVTTDVVIYGGTPAGLSAAATVTRQGGTAIVIEPTSHIGGMITGGIAITDTGTPQFVGGIAAEFFDQTAAENRKLYPNPPHPTLIFRGKQLSWYVPKAWDLEPKTARSVFEGWARRAGYRLILNQRIARVNMHGNAIWSIQLTNGSLISGKQFIDASYEGDLMAQAHVSHTYGRESRSEYGESLAGIREPHFIRNYSAETYQTRARLHASRSVRRRPFRPRRSRQAPLGCGAGPAW